jgi:hypothetical protein
LISTQTKALPGNARSRTASLATPVKKQFIVLANSVKKGGGKYRCVAGIEVSDEVDGDLILDDWIRPVSSNTHDEGALTARHFTFADGTQAAPLDIVECQFNRAVGNEAQPENWLLDEDTVWKKTGEISLSSLPALLEEPVNLWCQPGVKTDRIAPDYLPRQALHQSLVLIQIPRGQLHRSEKGRFRLAFVYQGKHYDLSVTDPRITPALVEQHGSMVEDVIACISLPQPFSGDFQPTPYHYKLVATLFWQCP